MVCPAYGERPGDFMVKAGVFFAEGYEEIEALTVVDLCRRAGMEVSMVAVGDDRTVTGSHNIAVQMDQTVSEADFDSFDILVLPGGMPGTRNLENCERLMEELDRFYREERWIAAICAAPSIFGHRGYLQGKKATAYPSFTGHLEGADVVAQPAVCDGNVITGQGMGAAIAFGLLIVEKLLSRQAAAELSGNIVYER